MGTLIYIQDTTITEKEAPKPYKRQLNFSTHKMVNVP